MTFRRILVPAAIACIVVFGLLPIAEPYLRRLIVVARFANMPAPTFLIVPVEGASKQIKDSWGDPRSGSRTHKGVDIFSPQGAPVRSTTDGLILPVGTNRLGGNIVTVLGPGLCVHYYAHLDHFGVFDAGDIIKQGDILGCVGNTGNAKGTPSHLHYGIYMPGKGAIATYVAVFGYDGKSFTTIDDQSLGLNESTGRLHVRSVFEDSKGNLWIGNNGIGVILHDGHAFTQFSQENGLGKRGMHGGRATPQPGDVTDGSPTLHRVFSIGEDRNGNIWFGTVENGAWRYDGKSLKNYTAADGLTSNDIMCIYTDRHGGREWGVQVQRSVLRPDSLKICTRQETS